VNDVDKYQQMLLGPIERFDPHNNMFGRARYEAEWIERSQRFYDPNAPHDKAGYTSEDYALRNASWYVHDVFPMGASGSNRKEPHTWDCLASDADDARPSVSMDAIEATHKVKRAALFFGAALVGVCELDKRWVFSHVTYDSTGQRVRLELPEAYRYAVAMAVEMDYALMQTAPTGGAGAATGLGYSKMAFVSGLLAQFIRNMGYKAVPCGNDTALSIPIAIEAGLGELGRNGLLITEKYGPRVRVAKIFTNLPLVPDQPRFFGMDAFCRECMLCAEHCPSRAISFGEKTTQALNHSNNPGVLKWPVNAEQCYKYWIANQMDCADCIRVCPFNKEQGRLHDLVRACVRHAPWLNPLLVKLDDALGYGKQRDPTTIWERI
jgi:epoxyqueuosine reductase